MNAMPFLFLCILALLVPNPVFAESEPFWKEVNGWQVRVDRTLDYGCFIVAAYERTVLRVGFNKKAGTGYIMVGNNDWKSLEVGKEYRLEMQFDDAPPWNGLATASKFDASDSMAFLFISFEDPNLVVELMKKQRLVFRYGGRQIVNLSLRGSHAAVTEMIQCQSAIDTARRTPRSSPSDPFTARSPGSSRDPFSY